MNEIINPNQIIAKASRSSLNKKLFVQLKEQYENLEASTELLLTSDKEYSPYYYNLLKQSFDYLQQSKQNLN